MTGIHHGNRRPSRKDLAAKVARKERRKERARHEQHETVWFGLGTFGLVGWSVTVPALIGIATGLWIDARWPSRLSWTLMLMVFGVALGCVNAWKWISREGSQFEDKPYEDDSSSKTHGEDEQ